MGSVGVCGDNTVSVCSLPSPHPQMSADYDHLSLLQKVEVFEHALESTRGDDLAKVLWLKIPNSEVTGGLGAWPRVLLSHGAVTACADTRALHACRVGQGLQW